MSTKAKRTPREVREMPAYTVAEAARYLSMPPATLRSWFAGIEGHFAPVIKRAMSGDGRLSFSNVVEAHVLRAVRTKHGISMPHVRKAIDYVQREYDIPRLLVDPGLRAAPGKLFLKRYAELVELNRSGQHVIEQAFAHHLDALVRDPAGVPIRLFPWIPDPTAGPRRSIVIDPSISFGRPVTTVRGITTAVLADQFDAGASLEDLAADYGLSGQEVEDALAFERAAA